MSRWWLPFGSKQPSDSSRLKVTRWTNFCDPKFRDYVGVNRDQLQLLTGKMLWCDSYRDPEAILEDKKKPPFDEFRKPYFKEVIVHQNNSALNIISDVFNLSSEYMQIMLTQGNEHFQHVYNFCSTAFDTPFCLCHIVIPTRVVDSYRPPMFHPRMNERICGIVEGHQAFVALRIKQEFSWVYNMAKLLTDYLICSQNYWTIRDKLNADFNECRILLDDGTIIGPLKNWNNFLTELRNAFNGPDQPIAALAVPQAQIPWIYENQLHESLHEICSEFQRIFDDLPSVEKPAWRGFDELAELIQQHFASLLEPLLRVNQHFDTARPAEAVKEIRELVEPILLAKELFQFLRKECKECGYSIPPLSIPFCTELENLNVKLKSRPFVLMEKNTDFWCKRIQGNQISTLHKMAVVVNRATFSRFRHLYRPENEIFWYFDETYNEPTVIFKGSADDSLNQLCNFVDAHNSTKGTLLPPSHAPPPPPIENQQSQFVDDSNLSKDISNPPPVPSRKSNLRNYCKSDATVDLDGFKFMDGAKWSAKDLKEKIVVVRVSRNKFCQVCRFHKVENNICWVLEKKSDVLKITDEQSQKQTVKWMWHRFPQFVEFGKKRFLDRRCWKKSEIGQKMVVIVSEKTFISVQKYFDQKFQIFWVMDTIEQYVLEIYDKSGDKKDQAWLDEYCQETVKFEGKEFVNDRWWNRMAPKDKVVVIVSRDKFVGIAHFYSQENDICWILAVEPGVLQIIDGEGNKRDFRWFTYKFSKEITCAGKKFLNRRFWKRSESNRVIVVIVAEDTFQQVERFYDETFSICWVIDYDHGGLEIYDGTGTQQNVDWLADYCRETVNFAGSEFVNGRWWKGKVPIDKVFVTVSKDRFAEISHFHLPENNIFWVLSSKSGALEIFDESRKEQSVEWLIRKFAKELVFAGKRFRNHRRWKRDEIDLMVVVIVSDSTFKEVEQFYDDRNNEICWVLRTEKTVLEIFDENGTEQSVQWLKYRFSKEITFAGRKFHNRRFCNLKEVGHQLLVVVAEDTFFQVERFYDEKYSIYWVIDYENGVLEICDEQGARRNVDWLWEYLLTMTIMFIGQSGAGKSTLINGIPNYLRWPCFADAHAQQVEVVVPVKFDVQPADNPYTSVTVQDGPEDSNENFDREGQSVTQRPRTYRHRLTDGTPLRIIDTPGLSDTRGSGQDETNLDLIREALMEVQNVHAVCFVLDANKSRLTAELELALRDLLTLFPQTVQSVVFFFFTYANSTFFAIGDTVKPLRHILNDVKRRHGTELPLRPENHFCVDNESLRLLIAEKKGVRYSNRPFKDFAFSWEKTTDAVGRFFREVQKLRPLPTTEIARVRELTVLTKRVRNFLAAQRYADNDYLVSAQLELEGELARTAFVTLPEPQPDAREKVAELQNAVAVFFAKCGSVANPVHRFSISD